MPNETQEIDHAVPSPAKRAQRCVLGLLLCLAAVSTMLALLNAPRHQDVTIRLTYAGVTAPVSLQSTATR